MTTCPTEHHISAAALVALDLECSIVPTSFMLICLRFTSKFAFQGPSNISRFLTNVIITTSLKRHLKNRRLFFLQKFDGRRQIDVGLGKKAYIDICRRFFATQRKSGGGQNLSQGASVITKFSKIGSLPCISCNTISCNTIQLFLPLQHFLSTFPIIVPACLQSAQGQRLDRSAPLWLWPGLTEYSWRV